ncbi:class II aldolase/adducin family protein [Desulfoluna spongiiphila]|uniref:class II aldolase/adducin family protein n=1 Tax=Desulfoluna spongiiphila TaxID=419481 RepID=UPI0012526C0B|nr:class II aldolase/adducin family protein [Desulfoluna spongiiphila]VVS94758.1 class ii aldolase/adducin n-terminal [Desulfoluna spongiiphila]
MPMPSAPRNICEMAQTLLSEGLCTDHSGCLSARVGGRLWITPEDTKLSELTPDALSVVDLATCTPLEGPRPDRRFALHRALYKKRKHLGALLHADPLSILTASRAGRDVPPLLDDMAQLVGISARIAQSWPCRGTAPVIAAMRGRNAVLLKYSGALCGAGTFDDAHAVAQVLEKNCKAVIEATFLGGGITINRGEALLMRTVYQLTYARQNTKNVPSMVKVG